MILNLNNISNICQQNPNLYLSGSALSGRGVFSKKDIKRGELIEECPLIVFDSEQSMRVKNTVLYFYYFILQAEPLKIGLALGYGSVYNHNYPCNAVFDYVKKRNILQIKAFTHIPSGTEITLNYNGDPTDSTEVIFPSKT